MKKFKFLLIVMLGFFFLASCSLDQTKFPTDPGDDEITEGEESYTLTFKYYDSLETIVSYTKKITNPVLESDISVTVPNGYALSFVDEAGQVVDVENIRTTSTVYVKFSPKEYTLRFIEGGTVVSNKLVAYNETIEAIEATKVPTGKKFIGWSSSENEYVEYVFDKMPSESVVLYAFYEELQYSITLKTNVVALEGYNNVTTYKYGDRLGNFVPSDLQTAIDSLDNYVFAGWYLDEACTEKFNEIAMPAKNITLYAKWDYAGLTFFDGTSIIEVLDGELGDTIVFPEVPEKAGYTFVGWFYDEEFTQEVPANAVITEDLRAIYAKYSSNERPYKVEYYLQSLGVSYVLNVDATINAKGNTGDFVTAEIKSFEGFTYNENHQGNVVEGNILGDGSLVLKVYYTRNSYSIKFYTDDNLYHEATLKYGAEVVTPSNPSKVGYTFKGWSPVVPTTMPANDVTVEAVFEINTYVFTYIVEGVETEVEYQYGAAVATPATPSKGGFKFAGWSPVVPTTMPANDVTVEATWIKKVLEVGEGKDYSTITEALFYAEAGDTITVFAGKYSEDVVIEKSITINGANVNINPNTDVRNSASVVNTFTIKASNVTINGFDIADATTSKSLITISNGNYSNISIENIVVLKQTVFSNNAYGIITASATETNEITNLVIDGLRIEQSTKRSTAFYGCQINGFTLTNSELLGATVSSNFTDCIKIATDGSYGLKGNISITNNVFKDYHQYVLWLREIGTSVIEVANNEFINCGQTAESHGAFTLASYASNAQTISVDFHDNELDNAYIMFRVDAWNNATSENLILNCNNNNIKNSLGTYHVKNGNSVSLVDATNNTYDVVPTADKFLNAIYYTITYNDQEASWGYKDFEDLAADLLKDYNTYTGKSYTKDTIPSDAWTSINLDDFFYSGTNKAKWSWLTDLLGIIGGSANKKALSLLSKYSSASEFNAINSNYQFAVTYELRAVMMIGKYTNNANYITSDYSDVNIQNQIMTTLKNSLAITKGTGEHTLTNKLYKEGYTFVGWYDNPEFTGTPITSVSYDATLYAKFSKNISISYEENGGNWGYASYEDLIADLLNDYNTARNKSHTVDSFYALGSMSEISDASLFLYNATYRAKWAWLVDYIASVAGSANKAAWSNFNKYNSQAELNAAGSNNIYCIAYELRGFIGGRQYTQNSGFVTYDYSVDSNKTNAMNALAKSIKIEKGFDVITLPTDIYKDGYTFIGWYDNAEFNGTPITTVTDNITVYARFDLNIDIEFEYNDGNYNYESYEELINDLVKDFNDFVGKEYTVSSFLTLGAYDQISPTCDFLYNATYRAKWAWLVEYIASVADSSNKQAWIDFNNYDNTTDFAAAGGNYNYRIAYEFRAFIGGGIYTKNQYFTTHDYSGNTQKTNAMNAYNESIEVTTGVGSITLPTNLYKQHYTFVGWYDNAEFNGTPITVATSNMTLYAKWIGNPYEVVFDSNTGTGSMENQEFVYNTSENLNENGFVKEGYTFIGWSTTPSGLVQYANGQEVINLSNVKNGQVLLYAQWKANKYTIEYNSNTGTGLMENQEFTYDISDVLNENAFTKLGYNFIGWSTTQDGDVEFEDQDEILNLTEENSEVITLYAVWEEKTILVTGTITFNDVSKRTEFTTSKQVWGENGIIVTNNKASSTTDVANYCNPARFYKSSDLEITAPGKIVKAVFNCTSSYLLNNNIDGATVTKSGTVVTVEFSIPVESIIISKLANQTRASSIEITYVTSELAGLQQKLQADRAELSTEITVSSESIVELPQGTLPNGTIVGEWTATPSGYIDLETLIATATEKIEVILTTILSNEYYQEEFSIVVTIMPKSTKIGDTLLLEDDASVEVVGTVVAVSTNGFIIEDATGAIFVYQNQVPTVVINDVVNVKGTLSTFNGGKQIQSPIIDIVDEEAYIPGLGKELSASQLESYYGSTNVVCEKVVINGVISISGSYYDITFNGTTKVKGSLYNATDAIKNSVSNGNLVTVEGYVISVSGTIYINIISTNIEKQQITVTLDYNNGVTASTNQTITSGDLISIPFTEDVIAPTGKVLSGWKDNNGNDYIPGEDYSINESVTITAIWADESTGSDPEQEVKSATADCVTNFSKINSGWSSSYASKTAELSKFGIADLSGSLVFSNVSKQTSTITDRPVMSSKSGTAQYVTLSLTDATITSVTFNLKEWTEKKLFKTIAVEYTTNGSTWTAVSGVGASASSNSLLISSYSTLTVESLPAGVTGVRMVIMATGSSNVQVGITSVEFTYKA